MFSSLEFGYTQSIRMKTWKDNIFPLTLAESDRFKTPMLEDPALWLVPEFGSSLCLRRVYTIYPITQGSMNII